MKSRNKFSVEGRELHVGDLVRHSYRGDSGITYRIDRLYVTTQGPYSARVVDLSPVLDPCGQPVTKAHGYQRRKRLSVLWLRWPP